MGVNMKNLIKNDKNSKSVHLSYLQRRRPIDVKKPPHVRYNPDDINKKEEEIEL